MAVDVLADNELGVFLNRKRRDKEMVGSAELGAWIAQVLEFSKELVGVDGAALWLDRPLPKRTGKHALTLIASFGIPKALGTIEERERSEVMKTYHGQSEGPCTVLHEKNGDYTLRVLHAIRLEQSNSGVLELLFKKDPVQDITRPSAMLADYLARTILNAIDIVKQSYLARHDDLTGVWNLRALEQHLYADIQDAKDTRTPLSVAFVDVDHLKSINDAHGHRAGSQALKTVARVLDEVTEGAGGLPLGRVYRFGGDEFVVVLPRCDTSECQNLMDTVRGLVEQQPGPTELTVSVGTTTLEDAKVDTLTEPTIEEIYDALLASADAALYAAKEAGRNRVDSAKPAPPKPSSVPPLDKHR